VALEDVGRSGFGQRAHQDDVLWADRDRVARLGEVAVVEQFWRNAFGL
jgi:hypothetical protein